MGDVCHNRSFIGSNITDILDVEQRLLSERTNGLWRYGNSDLFGCSEGEFKVSAVVAAVERIVLQKIWAITVD